MVRHPSNPSDEARDGGLPALPRQPSRRSRGPRASQGSCRTRACKRPKKGLALQSTRLRVSAISACASFSQSISFSGCSPTNPSSVLRAGRESSPGRKRGASSFRVWLRSRPWRWRAPPAPSRTARNACSRSSIPTPATASRFLTSRTAVTSSNRSHGSTGSYGTTGRGRNIQSIRPLRPVARSPGCDGRPRAVSGHLRLSLAPDQRDAPHREPRRRAAKPAPLGTGHGHSRFGCFDRRPPRRGERAGARRSRVLQAVGFLTRRHRTRAGLVARSRGRRVARVSRLRER